MSVGYKVDTYTVKTKVCIKEGNNKCFKWTWCIIKYKPSLTIIHKKEPIFAASDQSTKHLRNTKVPKLVEENDAIASFIFISLFTYVLYNNVILLMVNETYFKLLFTQLL